MNQQEAISVMEDLRRKGWSFEINADEDGWRCEVVGAGLAHALCSADLFENAVFLAVQQAAAMVDDPAVIIAKYEEPLKAGIAWAFGEIRYRIEAQDEKYEWGPKLLQLTIEANTDVQTMVDRETKFYGWLGNLPEEIRGAVRLQIEWPEAVEGKA